MSGLLHRTAAFYFPLLPPEYLWVANYLLLNSADERNKTALNTVK